VSSVITLSLRTTKTPITLRLPGFFSSEAIEAAVRQARQNAAAANNCSDEDEDSDCT
jgi:hypothetical protein